MSMPKDLVLVRHGQSEGNMAVAASKAGDDQHIENVEFAAQHSSWWRLTDQGISQAQLAGEWIRAEIGSDFDRYYTSAYSRALETAGWLSLPEARWYVEPRLRERDRGRESLLSAAERELLVESNRERQSAPLYWRPLGGESIADCCNRVRDVLDTLQRETSGKRVLIVCHGEVMESFRVIIERLTASEYGRWISSENVFDKIHNGQVFHFSRQNPDHRDQELSPYLSWVRSICTTDPSLSDPSWREIKRPVFSNEELLQLADETPRLIS